MVYLIPLGGFVGACFYKSNHKGSCLGLDSLLQVSRLSLCMCEGLKHGMGCVDSCLVTWNAWIACALEMFMESLQMYCNGFSLLNNT